MHRPPQGESIWGIIDSYEELANDIYMVTARDEDNMEHMGVMVREDTAHSKLSKRAKALAEEDGEWYYFDENTKDIPVYETLQRRVALCKRIENAALTEMNEIKRDGKLSLTDYFGECIPPVETCYGKIANMMKIRNGIYFTQDQREMLLAVHEAVADNYMSEMATEAGQRMGDYVFYDMENCAIAFNELQNVFDEVESLIISVESLNATLYQRFIPYITAYNELMPEKYQIPWTAEKTDRFLRVQLEKNLQ